MLANEKTIELIGRSEDGASYELVLVVEHGEWQRKDALWLLQEKINASLIFALDGQMAAEVPESKGKPVSITVRSVDTLPPPAIALLQGIEDITAQDGIQLRWEQMTSTVAA